MTDQSFIERLAGAVQVHSVARQVYGEPVERGGTTIIPVARVQWGFGGGAVGRGPAERGGGGGGVRAQPAGYIEVKDGRAEFRPIDDPGASLKLAAAGAAGVLVGLLLARLARS